MGSTGIDKIGKKKTNKQTGIEKIYERMRDEMNVWETCKQFSQFAKKKIH